jgi:hypothetical protein
MIRRIIMFMLIITVAIPVTTLTPPDRNSQAPWGESAVVAKGKKGKKKPNQTATPPRFTTVTRTVRQPVTQTFTSTVPLTIPKGAAAVTTGAADPYPATIEVSGFANGTITDVNLILEDFTHESPFDVDILLTRSSGRQAMVMSDVGFATGVTDIDLTLDDEAAASLPGGQLVGGTFRPTFHRTTASDDFVAPAPAHNGSVRLRTFDGADPNGTWQLWVMDNGEHYTGDIGSWALQITAEIDAGQVEEQVPVQDPVQVKDKPGKKKPKHTGKGKGRR